MALHFRNRLIVGSRRGWPVFLLLLAAVVLPTACILWFMTQAMDNERFAVRQKLADVYQGHLVGIRDRLTRHWELKLKTLVEVDPSASPQSIFAKVVREGICDSAIVLDSTGGIAYPVPPRLFSEPPSRRPFSLFPSPGPSQKGRGERIPPPFWGRLGGGRWDHAVRLEREELDYVRAASAYAAIAESATYVDAAAQALRAQARCLANSGQKDRAIVVLTERLGEPRFGASKDDNGRLVAPDALLYALRLMEEQSHPRFADIRDRLEKTLNDYGGPEIPSSQRLFLADALVSMVGDEVRFPLLEAEMLAARYVEREKEPPAENILTPSSLEGVRRVLSEDRRIIVLFEEETLIREFRLLVEEQPPMTGASVNLVPPGEGDSPSLLLDDAGSFLPGWRIAVNLEGPDPFETAADRQVSAYLWIGLLAVMGTFVLALFVVRYLGREMRLTRLKNDLIATVSHELKTPLSSMRLLVDTLIEGKVEDRERSHEYLEMIAKENERLSRLIDNFLTFSRMERNKQVFSFEEIDPGEVAQEAVGNVRERFESAGFALGLEIEPGLPRINADREALATVLLNLLDNAYKYSAETKQANLAVRAIDGDVRYEVSDKGIGLSRRARKKIFERFYQVDRTLSRETGGCGLGLSIVRFIVEAHGGTVRVTSQLGRGSRFVVILPT